MYPIFSKLVVKNYKRNDSILKDHELYSEQFHLNNSKKKIILIYLKFLIFFKNFGLFYIFNLHLKVLDGLRT